MNEREIYILSGEIQSGKTTRLREWLKDKKNVCGFLTPVIAGKRQFFDIEKNVYFNMEADEADRDIISTGKFIFSKKAFDAAEKIIEGGLNKNAGWIVIDEIGPLELRGEGFSMLLKKILQTEERNYNLVVVIRRSILDDAIKYFNIRNYNLLNI
jgi:nucleoside-triphosphatase